MTCVDENLHISLSFFFTFFSTYVCRGMTSSKDSGKSDDEESGEDLSLNGDPIIFSIGSIDLSSQQILINFHQNKERKRRKMKRRKKKRNVRGSERYDSESNGSQTEMRGRWTT